MVCLSVCLSVVATKITRSEYRRCQRKAEAMAAKAAVRQKEAEAMAAKRQSAAVGQKEAEAMAAKRQSAAVRQTKVMGKSQVCAISTRGMCSIEL